MGKFWQPRHRWQCILLFLVGLIAYGQHRTPEYWTMWVRVFSFFFLYTFDFSFRMTISTNDDFQVTLMIFQGMILISDLMFLSGSYDYDPYYKVILFLFFLFDF